MSSPGRSTQLVSDLARDEPVLDALAAAGVSPFQYGRSWCRRFGQLEGLGESATLVFEATGSPRHMVAVRVWAGHPPNESGELQRLPFGWALTRSFVDDPALPSLPALCAEHPTASVLRYRPGRRCTLRIEEGPSNPAIAKVFTDDRGREVHQIGLEFHHCAREGRIDVEIARPLGWDSSLRTLWQSLLTGDGVLDTLLSSRGPELARRMGEAAGSLPRSGIQLKAILDGPAQLDRSRRYARRLTDLLPGLAKPVRELIAGLEVAHDSHGPSELFPIHGSPHGHQWIAREGRLGLVDLDRASMGEPEVDVATFLAEIDYEDPETAPLAAIQDSFRLGYEARFGPLRDGLLQAYRAHKHLSKAVKNARALRPRGATRAAACLEQALETLAGAEPAAQGS